jgi:hypothetical protein
MQSKLEALIEALKQVETHLSERIVQAGIPERQNQLAAIHGAFRLLRHHLEPKPRLGEVRATLEQSKERVG